MTRGRLPRFALSMVLLAVCTALTAPAGVASDASVSVPQAVDLRADARLAADTGRPLMLVFTRQHCGYCALLKRAVIVPMLISGEYEDRIIIRELMIDTSATLIDFAGREASPFAVADRYDAFLTPTVLLVGPSGDALHAPLLGISNQDMYLFYLDQAIERAAASLAAGPAP